MDAFFDLMNLFWGCEVYFVDHDFVGESHLLNSLIHRALGLHIVQVLLHMVDMLQMLHIVDMLQTLDRALIFQMLHMVDTYWW